MKGSQGKLRKVFSLSVIPSTSPWLSTGSARNPTLSVVLSRSPEQSEGAGEGSRDKSGDPSVASLSINSVEVLLIMTPTLFVIPSEERNLDLSLMFEMTRSVRLLRGVYTEWNEVLTMTTLGECITI